MWLLIGGVLVVLVLLFFAVNPAITAFIEGGKLRALLDKETSKGMKFEAHYAELHRDGLLGLRTDSFHGENGQKTIVSMDAHDVTGWFNPLGIALRHWEVHAIHIKTGTVMLKKSEPTPGAPKGPAPIPWTALFWPYRVELEDVKVDDAKVLFNLRDKESGIYHTALDITPNGRDFEYDARGGTFRTPLTPELNVQRIHLLIRKPRLYCEVFTLGDDPAHSEEQIRIKGDAGLQDDLSMHVSAVLDGLQISAWLPASLHDHVSGHASGTLDYHSVGTGLETADGKGTVTVDDAVLHQLPAVATFVKLTASPDPGDLHLKVCRTGVRWEKGAITAEDLAMECPGVFKIDGTVTMAKDGALSGELHLGLTDPYLKWLPTAKTAIFTRQDGDYYFTTIQVSGTAKKPIQDLSPRITHEIEKSPGTALKLFFRAL